MHLVLYQNDVYFFRPQIYNYLCLIPSCHTTYLHYLILILPIAETSYYHNKHETPHKYNVVNNTLKIQTSSMRRPNQSLWANREYYISCPAHGVINLVLCYECC